jgi:DNA-binding NarL/FixJ family response regulator
VRVQIVDKQVMFAEAIEVALRAQGVEDVSVSHTRDGALRALETMRSDVVLLGVGLPGLSGFLVGQEILQRWPDICVLLLTTLIDGDTVKAALQAGFRGVLTRDTDVNRMLVAMRRALTGESVVPTRLTDRSWSRRQADEASILIEQLTRREHQVLMLLAEGCDSDVVAKRLGIARNTVRTHVHSILGKLNVHTRLEAAAFAERYGMVEMSRERAGSSG